MDRFLHTLRTTQKEEIKIILVQFNTEFPSEIPDDLQSIFDETALELDKNNSSQCWNSIIERLDNPKEEETSYEVFLCYKRKTGQLIATTLYFGLQERKIKVFLDLYHKPRLHSLPKIASKTPVFIFILSEGIFDSHYCLQGLFLFLQGFKDNLEITAAHENHNQILVLQSESTRHQISDLPTKWEPFSKYFFEHNMQPYSANSLLTFFDSIQKSVEDARNRSNDNCLPQKKKQRFA